MKTTGFSRISKDLIIGEIEREIKSHPIFFVAQHGGVPATSMDKLRVKLRQSHARYLAVKNSLGKKALEKKADVKPLGEFLTGSCGIAFSSGDLVASSKVLVDFAKENENFKIQSAYFNGEIVGVDKVRLLASLPSREVLIAKVVGGVQAPLSRFVGVLSGTIRKLVTALDAVAKKKGSAS